MIFYFQDLSCLVFGQCRWLSAAPVIHRRRITRLHQKPRSLVIGTNSSTGIPQRHFLLSKVSPLTAVDSASFSKLAAQNHLDLRLPSFCSSAKLFCFPDLSLSLEKHSKDVSFAVLLDKNFTDYGSGSLAGADTFMNYSENDNVIVDSFRRYSRDSAGHKDQFDNYAGGSNVVDQSFNTYSTAATGGSGNFKNYNHEPFTSYTEDANSGQQSFSNYGKNGNGVPNEFSSYGKGSNVIGSDFSGYGQKANGAKDTFTSHAFDNSNNPVNGFKSYGEGGNAAVDSFSTYRDHASVGDSSFQSYAKGSNGAEVDFSNYAKGWDRIGLVWI
ncbi:JP650 protein [Hibiscus syriacus]|uniref:JP650 protein n=1 Tax=Hibiscus syriacus TaxID=106335 RepID=A0A6A2WRE2_HIBSY|nr:JP650 protein [Hibiscus syriacus]